MKKLTERLRLTREHLIVILLAVIPVFLVWLPFFKGVEQWFFLKIEEPGFLNIIRNWDGPHYLVVAKSFYNDAIIEKLLFVSVGSKYYAAHLPFFPALIALFAQVFGWLHAGLIVTVLFGIAVNLLFYEIARKYTDKALLLTAIFSIFPGRFLVTRSVIAPETMTLFFTLFSLYLWEKKHYFWASVMGMGAVLIKIQALFLVFGYSGAALESWIKTKKFNFRWLWMGLIPGAFIILSIVYYFRMGDFLAFLSAQKENRLDFSLPFGQFNYANPWSLTGWLEDLTFYYLAMFLLIFALWKRQERSWFYFTLFFTLFLTTIPQRDMTRFSLPLLPLFLLTFHTFFTRREVKWAFLCLFPAIYFYAVNFILTNQAPVAD